LTARQEGLERTLTVEIVAPDLVSLRCTGAGSPDVPIAVALRLRGVALIPDSK